MIVYLAYSPGANTTLINHRDDGPVNLLVSFLELKNFLKHRHKMNIGMWCLDSGAFSVYNRKAVIALDDYIAAAKDSDANEIFSLDVIGDADQSRKNTTAMLGAGIQAIPTFHHGTPWPELEAMAKDFDKISLGGMARRHDAIKIKWLQQCFARIWPKKAHGFGCASGRVIMEVPFDSVDASSWTYAPQAFGQWAGFTGHQIPLHSKGVKDFWVEVLEHQKRERNGTKRWASTWAGTKEAVR